MNKFQRAKSKRIKKLQREMPGISYKKAKRLDRKVMHGAKRLGRMVARISRGCRAFCHEISAVAESLARLRETLTERKLSEDRPECTFLGTNYIFLDESTPMETTPALWPKENPYLKKEETNNAAV